VKRRKKENTLSIVLRKGHAPRLGEIPKCALQVKQHLDIGTCRYDGNRIHDSLALNGFNPTFCVLAGKLVLSIEPVNGRMKSTLRIF
jgi:hypothetical protein